MGMLAVAGGGGLYHEVRGSGPALVMIPGGSGDAMGYAQVADALADRFTVITYDRRGFSRSPIGSVPPSEDAQHADARLAADARDAYALLRTVGTGPAYVFGSSSGAIVALEAVRRAAVHQDVDLRRVVAHEPPLMTLLPDGDEVLAGFDAVYDTFRAAGVDPAMRQFLASTGLPGPPVLRPDAELPPHLAEMLARMRVGQVFWLENELRQYTRVRPDEAALAAAGRRLTLATGRDSVGLPPYRPAIELARRIGAGVADFPGDHIGYVTRPAVFAERLAEVLTVP